MLSRLIAAVALLFLAPFSRAIPIPSEPAHVVSLDGPWRFKLERPAMATTKPYRPGATIAPDYPAAPTDFIQSDYSEDGSWHDLAVPGNWEMAGFSPATYNQSDNASGLYRKWIDIPADWKDRLVKINFDGVQNGAEIWLNGKPVKVDERSWGRENYHESGWTAFQVDLTPQVKFGEKNLLAVRVTKNTKSADLDTGDYFFLGGIHRTVKLFSVPQTHLTDITIRTRLLPDQRAELKVLLDFSQPPTQTIALQLDGAALTESVTVDKNHAEFTHIVKEPKLWSAEFPNLYNLSIDLKDANGNIAQHLTKRIGLREVTIDKGVFKVNGVPVKLAGVCRHDAWASRGTALIEEDWRKDIEMIKAANFNAIRTSHYPYASRFYELCDEIGMYVADELPYCWCDTNNAELKPAFEQRARETVQRDKNHPSIVMWAIGNENKPGPNNRAASDVCAALDPTRPRLSSCHPAEEANTQFDDAHYHTPKQIRSAEADTKRRETIPMIYLESPNTWDNRLAADYGILDYWVNCFDRHWEPIWDSPHVAGAFLWEWMDRSIQDKATTKPYDHDDSTGMHFLKTKGLVDGLRNPRPNLFNTKMVMSPIKLGAKPMINDNSITVAANNYYSFTDLSLLETKWTALAGDKTVASGSAHLALAPLSNGPLKIDMPADAISSADALRLEFIHPDGRNVAIHQFALKPAAPAPTLKTADASVMFPRFNLVTFKNVDSGMNWQNCIRTRYHLADIVIQKSDGPAKTPIEESALLSTPLSSIRSLDATIVSDGDSEPAGKVHVDYDAGQFKYRLDWTRQRAKPSPNDKKNRQAPAGTFDVQEAGWTFEMPASFERFSWDRAAHWSWYPADHIGRPRGTAMPNSASANNTLITRADAFDYVSTKYDCNFASLTDATGKGLGAHFASDARHHVKAATTASGAHQLIINARVSPPRDISGNIVSDGYFTLSPGKERSDSFRVGTIGAQN